MEANISFSFVRWINKIIDGIFSSNNVINFFIKESEKFQMDFHFFIYWKEFEEDIRIKNKKKGFSFVKGINIIIDVLSSSNNWRYIFVRGLEGFNIDDFV